MRWLIALCLSLSACGCLNVRTVDGPYGPISRVYAPWQWQYYIQPGPNRFSKPVEQHRGEWPSGGDRDMQWQ
jgi:hypothetical protein